MRVGHEGGGDVPGQQRLGQFRLGELGLASQRGNHLVDPQTLDEGQPEGLAASGAAHQFVEHGIDPHAGGQAVLTRP